MKQRISHKYEERFIKGVLCYRHFPGDIFRPIISDLARAERDKDKISAFKRRLITGLNTFR